MQKRGRNGVRNVFGRKTGETVSVALLRTGAGANVSLSSYRRADCPESGERRLIRIQPTVYPVMRFEKGAVNQMQYLN